MAHGRGLTVSLPAGPLKLHFCLVTASGGPQCTVESLVLLGALVYGLDKVSLVGYCSIVPF